MLHRLTGGGFGLRLEAGLIGHAADYTTLKSSSGSGGFCSSIYRFQTSSVTLPLVATQYPRAHKCWPQYRFRNRAYSLNSFSLPSLQAWPHPSPEGEGFTDPLLGTLNLFGPGLSWGYGVE